MGSMNIPDEVLNTAAQLLWDVDSIPQDAEWDDLAPSFRASLMTQVEAAAQPIADWARKEALREATELVMEDGDRRAALRDRIEFLVAENEALRAEIHAHLNDPDFDVHHKALHAERDALRAQLDGMTVERSMRYRHSIASGDDAVTPVQRLVGPWTDAEGEPEPGALGPPRDLNPAFLRRDKK